MKKSNLYVEKIYKDHPIAVWPLDDNISFMQLLNYLDRPTSNWNKTNVASYTVGEDGFTTYNLASGTENFTSVLSGASIGYAGSRFTKSSAFFSINLYHPSYLIYKYEIGVTVNGVDQFSTFEFGKDTGNHRIGHTFDVDMESSITFFIKAYVYGKSVSGLKLSEASLGEFAEPYDDNGFEPIYLEAQSSPFVLNNHINCWKYPLDAYSINSEYNGIYLVKNGDIYAEPAGIPLAFGSYQSLKITQAPDANPSIIFPTGGFLNTAGIHNSYTLEFWMRCNNKSLYPVRLIGPLGSEDGLYVEGGYLTLKIGIYSRSYFVGKWYRPMLIHLKYSPNQFSLMINGEPVVSIDIDLNYLNMASQYRQYCGVWGNELVSPFEIDSIALYPYLIPPQMAKMHFVYGQGVQEYDFSNNKFSKKTIQIDYPVANYAYNVIYPDTMKWRSGYGISIDSSSAWIKPKTYELPQILAKLNGQDVDDKEWLQYNLEENNAYPSVVPYIRINPMGQYQSSCLYYPDLNIIQDRIYGILGVFESPSTPMSDQSLMVFNNKQTSETIKIMLSETTLEYSYSDPFGNSTIIDSFIVSPSTPFVCGLNLPKLSSENYSLIGNFFSSSDNISLSLGGTNENDMFYGKVFALHLLNEYFFNKDLADTFAESIFNPNVNALPFISYISNYSLIARSSNGSTYLDVSSSGYWEDVLPLSMFGKNIQTNSGTSYDLDLIQFNLDTPYFESSFSMSSANYSYFDAAMSALGIDQYQDLINYATSYASLNYQLSLEYSSLNSVSEIKSYVTIQPAVEAGTKVYSNFTEIVPAAYNRVIEIDMSTISNTKYEIFDNFTILIPQDIDFTQYFLGIHIELISKESISKPLIIKRCELSSFVANDGIPTPMGTKFSEPIYPYAVTT